MTETETKSICVVSNALADISLELDDYIAGISDADLVDRKKICRRLRKFSDRLGMASLNLQEIRIGVYRASDGDDGNAGLVPG